MKTNTEKQSWHWHRLDNTANLFPVITSKKFTNVYRLSVSLNETVQPDLLQQALEEVIPWFTALRVRMRKGLFWRYFEANPALPTIEEESGFPCRYIDPQQNNYFLFRVLYYQNRISVEIFHVLTDGTGGMQFLQALCCRYLMLAHPSAFSDEDKAKRWFAEHAANTEDSYVANYTPTKKSTFKEGRGYKISGERSYLDSLGVVHVYTSVEKLLATCRAKGVSITQYLTACIGWGIYKEQIQRKPSRWPVNIFLPVNLRNLFPSHTALNFFSNIYISLDCSTKNITFEDILSSVKGQFGEKVTKEAMLEKISYTVGSGYSVPIRMVPLPLKNMALRAIFEASAKSSTTSFSSLGKVTFPEPFAPYISCCSLLLSAAPREPFKCTAASYGNIFAFSFTSLLHSTGIQQAIVQQMVEDGLPISIETNGVYDENL